MQGKIKNLHKEQGYGIIETFERKVKGEEVIFYQSDTSGHFDKLAVGDTVEFLLEIKDNGLFAKNVRLLVAPE